MTYNLVFDVPDPKMLVSANQRIHWARRSAVCKYWRQLATLKARNARLPHMEHARIIITVRFPDRRHRDIGNLHGLLAKPLVDGLVDAGLLRDDSDDYLVGPDLRRDPERGPRQITVSVIDLSIYATAEQEIA